MFSCNSIRERNGSLLATDSSIKVNILYCYFLVLLKFCSHLVFLGNVIFWLGYSFHFSWFLVLYGVYLPLYDRWHVNLVILRLKGFS